MQGQDFHVPGQTFSAQPGGQVGGGGGIGVSGARGPVVGGIPTVAPNLSGLPLRISPPGQSIASAYSKSQASHLLSSSSGLHTQSTSEMGKQTHLQNQPPSMQQVYLQNAGRSVSQQNYYTPNQRPQQSRNLNPRNTSSGNPNQVVGIPTVGGAPVQSAAMYSHPNMTISSSPVYVQNQVSGIHANPHQQTVYSMNNQMPLQYSGNPQRHQTHQGQFQYPTYQPHTLLSTSNLYGYGHGTQHPGFFFHQPTNAQLPLSRSGTNSVGSSSQHLPSSLAGPQGATIVPPGNLQQTNHQQQNIHSLSVTVPQTDAYPNFNSTNSSHPSRSKKPRTKAIIDIVNPNTGKNISAEIYKDDVSGLVGGPNTQENPMSADCTADIVVADFAARVAKLASEPVPNSSSAESESTSTWLSQNRSNEKNLDQRNLSTPESTAILEVLDIPKEAGMDEEEEIRELFRLEAKNVPEQIAESSLSYSTTDDEPDLHRYQGNPILGFEESYQNNEASELVSSHPMDGGRRETPLERSIEREEEDGECVCPEATVLSESAEEQVGCKIDEEFPKLTAQGHGKEGDLEGETMQKQKHKAKVKGRESNRRNVAKNEVEEKTHASPIQLDSNLVETRVITDIPPPIATSNEQNANALREDGDKDNYGNRTQGTASPEHQLVKEDVTHSDTCMDNQSVEEVTQEERGNVLDDPKDMNTADTVDHVVIPDSKVEKGVLSSIVSLKNEENSRVSSSSVPSRGLDDSATVSVPVISSSSLKEGSLKYTYPDGQWSPMNTSGKKVYGREFLMKLQSDPKSKIKPINLPDLEVVLKDITKTRSTVEHRFKDTSLGRHDSLFPGFAKSSLSAKVMPPNKKSHSGKPKQGKAVLHLTLSLREDVKLRESEKPWRPSRTNQGPISEEQVKTEQLYKKVRSVLNKLTPQKFDTLVNQVRDLKIDTQERLQGVIDLVFEKAVDEPNFSVAYALMCKELSNIHVTGADSDDSSSANFRKLILTRCQTQFEKNTLDENIRNEKLKEIESCTDPEKKKEFQINFEDEERRIRIRSVGNIRFIGELFKQNMLRDQIMHQCIRHLLSQVDEENLECLCKLLTTIGKVLENKNIDLSDYLKQMQQIANRKGKISSRIRFMLQDVIDLKANNWIPRRDDSNPKTMDQIQREAESERLDIQLGNISLHTPRKDDRTGERKRNRGGVNSGGGNSGSIEDGGWSQPVSRTRQVYSVETAKLKNKPPSMDDMQLGSRSTYQWAKPSPKMTTPNKFSYLENISSEADKRGPNIHLSGSRSTGPRDYGRLDYKPNYDDRSSRNGSYQLSSGSYGRNNSAAGTSRNHSSTDTALSTKSVTQVMANAQKPQLTPEGFQKALDAFIDEFILEDEDIEEAAKAFRKIFPESSHVQFVQEMLNSVIEKSDHHRNKTSLLLARLVSDQCIDLATYKNGLGEILKAARDLIIDIPMLWKYLAKILVHPVANDVFALPEFRTLVRFMSSDLWSDGHAMIMMFELLTELKDLKGSKWTCERWHQSGLVFSDFLEENSKLDSILPSYNLDFITSQSLPPPADVIGLGLDMKKVHADLLLLLKGSDFDQICCWIEAHVNEMAREPQFIRTLMTVILETSIEQVNDKWTFKVENFDKLQKLIQRYVDADERLELQCLFAVQAYITKLSHPAGLLVKIMNHLCEFHILSNEAFLAWEKDNDPAERNGKSVALLSLKSFFIPLKEGEDVSDTDEPVN